MRRGVPDTRGCIVSVDLRAASHGSHPRPGCPSTGLEQVPPFETFVDECPGYCGHGIRCADKSEHGKTEIRLEGGEGSLREYRQGGQDGPWEEKREEGLDDEREGDGGQRRHEQTRERVTVHDGRGSWCRGRHGEGSAGEE